MKGDFGMKKLNKKIAVVTLVFVIGNFFIAPIANVFAESSTAVENYILDMNDKSSNIDSKFTSSKTSDLYFDNLSYKYAVDSFYNEYTLLKNNYNSYINNFENSISVRQVLLDSNSPLLEEYDSKIIDNKVFSFEKIEDVTYSNNEGKEEVLITGTSLAELINKTYFLDYSNKYDDFYYNYDSYITNYKSYYDEIINDYNTAKNTINGYISEINNFISNEKEKGNNPDTSYEKTDVITKLNSYITLLDSTLNKVLSSSYNNDFDSIVSDATNIKNYFFNNNKNITSDLIKEINDLKEKYKDSYDKLSDLLKSASIDISSPNYSTISSLDNKTINDFITLFEEIYNLDSKYKNLNQKVNDYLDRMPSEISSIKDIYNELNNYYEKINKDKISDFYKKFVYNANLSEEDIIDTLLSYDYLLSSEYKYLINAKKSFYTIKLVDDSKYKIEVKDNYLIIEGSSNIKKSSFSENIDYNGHKFELVGTSNILDKNTILKLYDREEKYLTSLKIIIKNDVNGDGLINNEDVNLLKSKVLYQKFTDYDKIASDINNDNILNITDVTSLNKIVNNLESSKGTKASFKVLVEETSKYVTYNIYLNTNGGVGGFEFDVKTSSNLRFIKAITTTGVNYLNNNEVVRVVGLGSYEDNSLVLKITFKKNLNNNSDISFILKNGTITLDNLDYNDNLSYKNVIKYQGNNKVEEDLSLSIDNSDSNTNNNKEKSNLEKKDKFLDTKDKELSSSNNAKKSKTNEEKSDNKDIEWSNVIKIAIIVLLGALIIYFLNKDTEVDFSEEDQKKSTLDEKISNEKLKSDDDKEDRTLKDKRK